MEIFGHRNNEPYEYWTMKIFDYRNNEPYEYWTMEILTNLWQYMTIEMLNPRNTEPWKYWTFEIINHRNAGSWKYWTIEICNLANCSWHTFEHNQCLPDCVLVVYIKQLTTDLGEIVKGSRAFYPGYRRLVRNCEGTK